MMSRYKEINILLKEVEKSKDYEHKIISRLSKLGSEYVLCYIQKSIRNRIELFLEITKHPETPESILKIKDIYRKCEEEVWESIRESFVEDHLF